MFFERKKKLNASCVNDFPITEKKKIKGKNSLMKRKCHFYYFILIFTKRNIL